MTSVFHPRFSEIDQALHLLNRRKAAQIVREDLDNGPQTGAFWRDIAQLAERLGEQKLSLEAARRYFKTEPENVQNAMSYAQFLLRAGRLEDATRIIDSLPASAQNHPAILNLRGVIATQQGHFASAIEWLEKAIAVSPAPIQWLTLSAAKTFQDGDKDIARMEALFPKVAHAPSDIKAQLHYALGKAYDDAGDKVRAAEVYSEGAKAMRAANSAMFGPVRLDENADKVISDFTRENLAQLQNSDADGRRMLFVTGYPRSGTTLVEQILTSHSCVAGGAEMNVAVTALMPLGVPDAEQKDFSFAEAMKYQQTSNASNPWGDIGRDYLHMVEDRFGSTGLAVDKTVNIGPFAGLLLHSLPGSKIIWLRRRPEDNALSIFRLYSMKGTVPWTYSASDIAKFFKNEDKLYRHWLEVFPDRILTVPYESLVSEPREWIGRMLAFTGLSDEAGVYEPHKSKRAVATPSMAQVRAPISTSRIGAAEAYADFTEAFRKAYYG